MLSKNQEKLVRSLHLKKQRKEQALFVVEGKKMLEEAMNSGMNISLVFATADFLSKEKLAIEPILISDVEMKKISSFTTAPGVLAVVKIPQYKPAKPGPFILAIDAVKDPGNLGTIIRSAEGFGVNEIICSEDTVDCYNSKVVQASMGSIFRMPVSYVDLGNYLKEAKTTYTIYGTSLAGENLYASSLKRPAIVVMGSESHGISEKNAQLADCLIKIPQAETIESMNVSIATAVILSEFNRQVLQQ